MTQESYQQTMVSLILITLILFAVYFSTRHYPASPKVFAATSTVYTQEEATPTPDYVMVLSNEIDSLYPKDLYDKNLLDSLSYGFFHANGAWVAINDDLVNKLNSVDMWCEQKSQTCILAQADFMKWNKDDSEIHFDNHLNKYNILSWDLDSGIIAKSERNGFTCQEDLIQINKSGVTLIESTKGDAGEECPKDIKPQILKLQSLKTELKY